MGIEHLFGGHAYKVRARLRINGKIVQKQITLTGGSREQAKAALEKLKAGLRAADGAGSSLKTTLSEVLLFYRARHEIDPNSATYFNRLESELGNTATSELRSRFDLWFLELKTMPGARGKLLSGGTTNRFLAWTNAALNFAVRAGVIRENPIRHIEKSKEVPRDVSLSREQEIRFLNVIGRESPTLLPAVRYMLQVPCRAWSEVVTMRREDVDLFNSCIRVRNGTTKGGAGIDKPIPPDMVEYMRSIPPESDFVFWRKVNGKYRSLGRFSKAWARCTRLAGLAGLRVHDLRHVAASRMVDAGTPEQVVMQVAGWKTNMLRVYYCRNQKKALELVRFSPQFSPQGTPVSPQFSPQRENICENIRAIGQ